MNISEILTTLSVDELLPAHNSPLTQADARTQSGGAERFRTIAAMQSKIQGQMEEHLEALKASLPPDAVYGVTVTVLPKGKPGSSAVTKELIRTILSPTSVHKTQEQCRSEVLAKYPGHSLSKDWGKPLPEWAVKYAKMQIGGCSAPINRASVRKGTSLSSLHRQVKRLIVSGGSNAQTYNVKLTVTPDALLLNGLSVKITKNNSGGHTYQYARVNVQSLLEALDVR